MKYLGTMVLLVLANADLAHGSDKNCENNASSMNEVRSCLEKKSELPLQKALDVLIELIKKKGMNNAAKVLEASQHAWRNYRDASCDYIYEVSLKSTNSGLYASDMRTNCLTDFNENRIRILQKYFNICQKNIEWCSKD